MIPPNSSRSKVTRSTERATFGFRVQDGRDHDHIIAMIPRSQATITPKMIHCDRLEGMAGQALNLRNKLVIYDQDTNGDWRSHVVTINQGGASTVSTGTSTDAAGGLDARKAAVYAANPVQTIHSEVTLTPEYP